MFKFKKLEIYNLSMNLVVDCYDLIKKFPNEEKYGLSSQMKRAAISIPSNIAEGSSRYSPKEKTHFINISYSSLMELLCQIEIAESLSLITKEERDSFFKKSNHLGAKINAFSKAIGSKKH
jgi:four helix bundle protein